MMADTKKAHAATTIDAAQLHVMHQHIDRMVSKIMPPIPHLLSVVLPSQDIKRGYFKDHPHEISISPFSSWEVKQLQYMTLVPFGDRGVALARGDWEDEINGQSSNSSSGLRSGNTTPRSQREINSNKPRVKISLTDYKTKKRPTDSQQSSQLGAEMGANGAGSDSQRKDYYTSRRDSLDEMRPGFHSLPRKPDLDGSKASSHSISPSKPARPSSAMNGHSAHPSSRHRIDDRRDVSPRPSPRPTHELPPRPGDYSRHEPHTKQLKRPLADAASPAEKRSKLEVNGVRPSKSLDSISKLSSSTKSADRLHVSSTKSSTIRSRSPEPSYAARTESKKAGAPKPLKVRTEKAGKGTDLPPMLSPLPAGLTSPDERNGFDFPVKSVTKSSKSDQPTAPRSPKSKSYGATKKRLDTPELLLPRLLSPDLPDIIEQELARMKSLSTSSPSSVEAAPRSRRDPEPAPKARRELTPEPAPRVRHDPAPEPAPIPAKKAEKVPSKRPREDEAPKSIPAKSSKANSLVVKIKYKRRQAKDIERILKMPSSSSKKYREYQIESQNDPPLKKRQRPSDETPEPVSKHVRAAESMELLDARRPVTPAFKSPSTHAGSQKAVIGTPKKSEGAKSTSMRKVESSDGLVRTPHTISASTPASSEKPRPSTSDVKDPEQLESYRRQFSKYNDMGTSLKREMDRLLQNKVRQANPPTEAERQLGAIVALESITAYMISFHSHDLMRAAEHKQNDGQLWNGLFSLLTFVHDKCRPFPKLYALSFGLAAICREELQRVLIATNEARVFEALARNARARDATWRDFRTHSTKAGMLSCVMDPELHDPTPSILAAAAPYLLLGPGSSVTEAAGLISKGLARCAAEMRVEWRKRVEF